jgi:hypothetical protein
MTCKQLEKPLPVVLRFWHRGVGHVRYLLPDGKWKWVTKLSEARCFAERNGYDGIRVRVFA